MLGSIFNSILLLFIPNKSFGQLYCSTVKIKIFFLIFFLTTDICAIINGQARPVPSSRNPLFRSLAWQSAGGGMSLQIEGVVEAPRADLVDYR